MLAEYAMTFASFAPFFATHDKKVDIKSTRCGHVVGLGRPACSLAVP